MSSGSTRADYAPSTEPARSGGVVASVDEESPAERAGVRAGDIITAADGVTLRDIIDWQWVADGPSVTIALRRDDADMSVELVREPGETWGIDFEAALFDRVRTCRNNCAFCFMSQLPKGLRRALYLRDDDYRLSFLQGNFVTLTNLSEDDVQRIVDEHLSPLYISLHAVDPEVRRKLVCAREDRALERFDELVEAGIDLHVQVVLVPGVNDGLQLDRTLTWLAEREGVVSVGIVPLGYTGHQKAFQRSYNDAAAAATVIRQVKRWQVAFRERDGVTWVYLADEFYLNAGVPVPEAAEYDGYPQYENGIGIVRSFTDDVAELGDAFAAAIEALFAGRLPVTLLSGEMVAASLAETLSAVDESGHLRILAVPNDFFGGNVGVTGLLTAQDLTAAVEKDGARGTYLLPDLVLNADGLTLDDRTLDEMREKTGADIRLVSSDAAGLLAGLEEVAAAQRLTTERE